MEGMWLNWVYRPMFKVLVRSSGGFCGPQTLNHISAPKFDDVTGLSWNTLRNDIMGGSPPFLAHTCTNTHTDKQRLSEIFPPTSFLSNEWLVLRYVLRRSVRVFPPPHTVWPDVCYRHRLTACFFSFPYTIFFYLKNSADDTKRLNK